MEFFTLIIDFVLHVDRYLQMLTENYGAWVYGILFLIVFCETGLVITPFLPGDSLLFVAGTLAGAALLDPVLLSAVLIAAAILGDSLNYAIGRKVGPAIYKRPDSRFIKQAHLQKTQQFFEKHGGKTIIIARFVPIIRTFAPFVAGIGSMNYRRFLAYNVIGGIVWVVSLVTAGYWLGKIAWVKTNLSLVLLGIIILSIMPIIIEYWRNKRQAKVG